MSNSFQKKTKEHVFSISPIKIGFNPLIMANITYGCRREPVTVEEPPCCDLGSTGTGSFGCSLCAGSSGTIG